MGKKFGLMKMWYAWAWLKHEGRVLWRALIDKDTPTAARVAALAVIIYVVSPIDVIPDFIPFVGWIDDLIVIPLGFALVKSLLPGDVWIRAGGEDIERRKRRRGNVGGMKDVTPLRR